MLILNITINAINLKAMGIATLTFHGYFSNTTADNAMSAVKP